MIFSPSKQNSCRGLFMTNIMVGEEDETFVGVCRLTLVYHLCKRKFELKRFNIA